MKKNKKFSKGITLIALVVTIIVLLILAGISIMMLTGDNGILNRSGDAKEKTEIAGEKEIVKISALASISKERYGEITKEKLDEELNKYSEIQTTEQTNNGIIVTFISGRAYLVEYNGNVSRYSEISIGHLIVKDGNTELEENCKSVQLGKALTISFDASIPGGNITSIIPSIAYTTSGEKSKTFTIVAKTLEGQEITKDYTVDLKGYYNIPELKVGDFLNYTLNTPTTEELTQLNNDILSYSGETDNTTKTAVGSTLLCRVLEIDETTGNPTRLISADGVNTLHIGSVNGYNNAVYLINEMCTTLYSGNKGTTKSLTIEDLENNYFSDTAIATRDAYVYSSLGYGQTKYFSQYCAYPNIAAEEIGMGMATKLVNGKNQIRTDGLDLSEQTIPYTGSSSGNGSSIPSNRQGITITQTYYPISSEESNYKNAVLSNIIHCSPKANGSNTTGVTEYWLASRCASTGPEVNKNCEFLVRYVFSRNIISRMMYSSRTNNGSATYAIRPVITLNSGIQAEYVKAYNSTYNTFTLY